MPFKHDSAPGSRLRGQCITSGHGFGAGAKPSARAACCRRCDSWCGSAYGSQQVLLSEEQRLSSTDTHRFAKVYKGRGAPGLTRSPLAAAHGAWMGLGCVAGAAEVVGAACWCVGRREGVPLGRELPGRPLPAATASTPAGAAGLMQRWRTGTMGMRGAWCSAAGINQVDWNARTARVACCMPDPRSCQCMLRRCRPAGRLCFACGDGETPGLAGPLVASSDGAGPAQRRQQRPWDGAAG